MNDLVSLFPKLSLSDDILSLDSSHPHMVKKQTPGLQHEPAVYIYTPLHEQLATDSISSNGYPADIEVLPECDVLNLNV
jgi:hypothetical protein